MFSDNRAIGQLLLGRVLCAFCIMLYFIILSSTVAGNHLEQTNDDDDDNFIQEMRSIGGRLNRYQQKKLFSQEMHCSAWAVAVLSETFWSDLLRDG